MKIQIIKHRKLFLSLSIFLVVASIVLLLTRGLNYGIDYTGGTVLQIATKANISLGMVQDEVLADPRVEALELGSSSVQLFDPGDELNGALIKTRFLEDVEEEKVLNVFEEKIGAIDKDLLQIQKVGPAIGSELLANALKSLLIAGLLMLIYISFRFKFKSGVAAVVALAHDVVIVLGFFVLTQFEVDGTFLAAILTLVGYSINDTIVIFDKVRENSKTRRGNESFDLTVEKSINQSLRRTINTSVTTLLAVIALLIFGGASIRNFTAAITLGILVGTYSSIFVATQVWALWETKTTTK
ncbi:MAG: protein translocase subunit SecF [Firmicutes bacterium]|nr:protein translocase subunit SecF [Bacillota bacterium]MDD4692956.1 protein translocase subunit SecF [Bacillota bacterium]